MGVHQIREKQSLNCCCSVLLCLVRYLAAAELAIKAAAKALTSANLTANSADIGRHSESGPVPRLAAIHQQDKGTGQSDALRDICPLLQRGPTS